MTDMNEQNNNPETETEDFDPIAEVQKLRENTVSKEEYDKLKSENKRLFKTLVENGQISNNEQTSDKTSKELRKELLESNDLSNLEYWKKTLELRDRIIEEGGVDPFLPVGNRISPTSEDVECANRVAKVVKDTIEYANGDSQLFTNELQRVTMDVRR